MKAFNPGAWLLKFTRLENEFILKSKSLENYSGERKKGDGVR